MGCRTREIPIEKVLTSLAYLKSSNRSLAGLDWDRLREPITVIFTAGNFEVVDGFKRLERLKARGDRVVTAVIQDWQRRRAKAMMLVLNSRSKTVSFYEEAVLVEDLCGSEGLSGEETAELLGRRAGWVSKRLSLVRRLEPDILAFLRSGRLGPTAAYHLSRLERAWQMPLFISAREQKLTVGEVEGAVALVLAGGGGKERARILRDPRRYLAGPRISRVIANSGFSGETGARLAAIEELTAALARFRRGGYQALPPNPLPANEDNVLAAALLRLRWELEIVTAQIPNYRRTRNEEGCQQMLI